MFNEEEFLGTMYDTKGDTKFPLVPEGADYVGVVKKLSIKEIEFDDRETGGKRKVKILVLHWNIDDPRLESALGSRTALVPQEFWLDVKADGALDLGTGKNVKLNQLGETFKLPVPWGPKMFVNQLGKLDVAHRLDQKTGDKFHYVRSVAPVV